MIEIPLDRISEESIDSIIEEIASREGTDYGVMEVPMLEKISKIKKLLKSGEVVLMYNEHEDHCFILNKNQINQCLKQ